MDLNIIKMGLSVNNRVSVSEHLNNHPMTDIEDNPYDSDSDPSVQLLDAAAAAERIVSALIAYPSLAAKVDAAINSLRAKASRP